MGYSYGQFGYIKDHCTKILMILAWRVHHWVANSVRTCNYEQYVPSLDKWIIKESMSTSRHGLVSATVDGNIYVIDGSENPGASAVGNADIFSPIGWGSISENKNP